MKPIDVFVACVAAAWVLFLFLFVALPAMAQPVAMEARGSNGNAVILYQDAGQCLAPARRAEYVSKAGDRVPGCYKLVGPLVQIIFLDADALQVPVEAFTVQKGA